LNISDTEISFTTEEADNYFDSINRATIDEDVLVEFGKTTKEILKKFDIKQPVYFADFNWNVLVRLISENKIQYKEIPKYPMVERDLALVVPKIMKYSEITREVTNLHLLKLRDIKLFDIFENEKLGNDKKSMAINFTFLDEEKTLTDKEIDGWMNKIITTLEKELGAEIRK
jgi:phenylalanyl-tRNA synthetase beta chain